MQSTLCRDIGGMCLFRCVMPAKPMRPAIDLQACAVAVCPVATRNAEKACLILRTRAAAVLHVYDMRHHPEISHPVIARVSVDVIHLTERKLAMHVNPSQLMRVIVPGRDAYLSAPAHPVYTTRDITHLDFPRRAHTPMEYATVRVITQNPSQFRHIRRKCLRRLRRRQEGIRVILAPARHAAPPAPCGRCASSYTASPMNSML